MALVFVALVLNFYDNAYKIIILVFVAVCGPDLRYIFNEKKNLFGFSRRKSVLF